MSIEQGIRTWDGKSAVDIQAVYDRYHKTIDFASTIIKLSFEPTHEQGATWLLKAWIEAGNTPDEAQISTIYESLNRLDHWAAKLHVLQIIPDLPIASAHASTLYTFLKSTITDENKFVRAWSYNGLHELSSQHPEYLNETQHYLERAMRDEAPSVKARIRNMLAKHGH